MKTLSRQEDAVFQEALQGLKTGSFSRLEPLFSEGSDLFPKRSQIIAWYDAGLFTIEPKALAEALTCACFLGRVSVADYLLTQGVDPAAGAGTGLDALHWAVNRGQLATVRLLIRRQVSLETRNMYGNSILGTAVWSAINEPRPSHLQIIEELLQAGAGLADVDFPTGNERVDAVLGRYGAPPSKHSAEASQTI
jgi:hypothetical protein